MKQFTIIETSGKQYKVEEGQKLTLEKLAGEQGASITFDRVLLVAGEKTIIGKPLVTGARVEAEIVSQGRAKKITIIKYKRKTHYRRKKGHRQYITVVQIKKITG